MEELTDALNAFECLYENAFVARSYFDVLIEELFGFKIVEKLVKLLVCE